MPSLLFRSVRKKGSAAIGGSVRKAVFYCHNQVKIAFIILGLSTPDQDVLGYAFLDLE